MRRMIHCLLCGEFKPHKSRYLCMKCYQNPLSKNLKIPVNFRVERMDREEVVRCPVLPPDEPTMAKPGTQEKIEILTARWVANRLLYHPDDAKENYQPIVPEVGDVDWTSTKPSASKKIFRLTCDAPEED